MEVGILPIEFNSVRIDKESPFSVGSASEPLPAEIAHISPALIVHWKGFARLDISSVSGIVETTAIRGLETLESALPPFMWVTRAGHGDIGAVLYLTDLTMDDLRHFKNPNEPGFEFKDEYFYGRNNRLNIRVSFGPGYTKSTSGGWVPSQFGRLHISTYGIRRFLPLEHPETLLKRIDTCFSEEVYFSLRWVANKDGIWEFFDPYGVFCEGADRKTTWMRLGECYPVSENIQRSNSLMLSSDDLDVLGQPVWRREEGNVVNSMDNKVTTHSGYKPVLNFLSQFGEVQYTDDVTRMTPEEGIDYLLDRVVPAVRRFTEYGSLQQNCK